MRDSSDVERTAEELRIQAQLHAHLQDASTVQAAADALDVDAADIGKSIVLMVEDEEPVVVLARGPDVVSLDKVADAANAAAEDVRLAEPDEIQTFTGYPVGAVPPIGHERPLRTLVDERVLDREDVYVGGGSEDVMLEIRAQDLRKLPDVSSGDFVEDE